MKQSALGVIEQLLAQTHEPPTPGADPADVLLALEQMTTSRTAGITTLKEILGPDRCVARECKAALTELQDRDARWQAAAEKARQVLHRRATSLTRIGKSPYGTASTGHTRTG